MFACHDTVLLSFQFFAPNYYSWIKLLWLDPTGLFYCNSCVWICWESTKSHIQTFRPGQICLGSFGLFICGGGSGLEQVLGTNNHGFILTHAGFVHDTGSSQTTRCVALLQCRTVIQSIVFQQKKNTLAHLTDAVRARSQSPNSLVRARLTVQTGCKSMK